LTDEAVSTAVYSRRPIRDLQRGINRFKNGTSYKSGKK
jgi:hypothetical protein